MERGNFEPPTRQASALDGKTSSKLAREMPLIQSTEVKTAHDEKATPRPNTQAGKKHENTWKLWLLEAVSLAASLACFIVIVIILVSYNNQPLPQLPFRITLNAFISFFGSLVKAGFMVPVVSCIGQTKWNWLNQDDRSLTDFELFDSASRGLWGSLALLYRLRWRHPASLAAFVTVISLVSSFFTQLLISYPTRPTPVAGVATVQAARTFGADDVTNVATNPIIVSAYAGTMNGYEDPVQPLDAWCPTGNCTYPVFSSMALCYAMANVTESLDIQLIDPLLVTANDSTVAPPDVFLNGSAEFNVSLPYGLYMVTQDLVSMVISPLAVSHSIAFADDADLMNTQVLSFGGIYSSPYNWAVNHTLSAQFFAFELLFHVCVNTYEVCVSESNTTTRIVNQSQTASPNTPRNDRAQLAAECPMQRWDAKIDGSCAFESYGGKGEKLWLRDPQRPSSWNSTNIEDHFVTDFGTLNILLNALSTALGTYISEDPHPITAGSAWYGGTSAQALLSVLSAHVPMPPQVVWDAVETLSKSLATSVTNSIRTLPKAVKYSTNSYTISGTALVMETYVSVSWGWLTFLSVQILLVVAVLAMTMLETARLQAKVLKTSSLATLFALDDMVRTRVEIIDNSLPIRKRVGSIQVRLKSDKITLAREDEDI